MMIEPNLVWYCNNNFETVVVEQLTEESLLEDWGSNPAMGHFIYIFSLSTLYLDGKMKNKNRPRYDLR